MISCTVPATERCEQIAYSSLLWRLGTVHASERRPPRSSPSDIWVTAATAHAATPSPFFCTFGPVPARAPPRPVAAAVGVVGAAAAAFFCAFLGAIVGAHPSGTASELRIKIHVNLYAYKF